MFVQATLRSIATLLCLKSMKYEIWLSKCNCTLVFLLLGHMQKVAGNKRYDLNETDKRYLKPPTKKKKLRESPAALFFIKLTVFFFFKSINK